MGTDTLQHPPIAPLIPPERLLPFNKWLGKSLKATKSSHLRGCGAMIGILTVVRRQLEFPVNLRRLVVQGNCPIYDVSAL